MRIRNSFSRLGLMPWLLIVVLTMTGCASGPRFQKIDDIPAGKALVYIYRPSVLIYGAGATHNVVINDLNTIPLDDGTYYPYFSAPGEVTFSTAALFQFDQSITIFVDAGETYYVRTGMNFLSGYFLRTPFIELVPAERGLPEISGYRRVPEVPGV